MVELLVFARRRRHLPRSAPSAWSSAATPCTPPSRWWPRCSASPSCSSPRRPTSWPRCRSSSTPAPSSCCSCSSSCCSASTGPRTCRSSRSAASASPPSWSASACSRCRCSPSPPPAVRPPAPDRPAGAANRIDRGVADIDQLGESLFTDYLFAFEITSVLLVIAVVGAVVLVPQDQAGRLRRRPARGPSRRRRADAEVDERRSLIAVAEVTPAWYLVLGRAVHDRRRRPAGAPQPAGDVHVRRADAQRRQPHVRHVLPHARRRAGQTVVSSCWSWPPPRSWSASGSSWPSSAGSPTPPPTTCTC